MTWLLIDGNNLAWRSHYTLGQMTHKKRPVGVLYGVLRDIVFLQKHLHTEHTVVCFDHGKNKRLDIYPQYRKHRKPKTPEEKKARKSVGEQLLTLKTEILPRLGLKNVLFQEGYEADDVIASVCQNHENIIIASNDKDLYQLLREDVMIWNYKQWVTEDHFKNEYNVDPSLWPYVKSIAGCVSDNVKGIRGVGEITALKHLKGTLSTNCQTFKNITSLKGIALRDKNWELVRLPFSGCGTFNLIEDEIDTEQWDDVCKEFDFETLLGAATPRLRGRTLELHRSKT